MLVAEDTAILVIISYVSLLRWLSSISERDGAAAYTLTNTILSIHLVVLPGGRGLSGGQSTGQPCGHSPAIHPYHYRSYSIDVVTNDSSPSILHERSLKCGFYIRTTSNARTHFPTQIRKQHSEMVTALK